MGNFVLIHHGRGETAQDEKERPMIIQAWGEWFGRVGTQLVDGGNPFSDSKTVSRDGVTDGSGTDPATGYSILEADSLDEAVELAKACPVLIAGGYVEVYETYRVT
jgi:hypothetical protein